MSGRSVLARLAAALCTSLPILAAPGCNSPEGEAGAKGAAPPPPDVTVALPIVRESYQDILEFTGRVEAMETVEIRARVQGFLEKINFKEGDEIKKGDLLYVIEQLPYKTDLAKAEADIQRQDAALARAAADLARANGLRQRNAITQADYDAAVATRDEAKAQLESLKATREQAKIQLAYTEIKAPIDGQISRTQVTVGNLVGFSQPTLLTTIVRVDKMFVYFDPDERGLLAYQKLVREGKAHPASEGINNAQVLLSSGDAFSATIDFRDNQVDPETGTIAVRAVAENPKPSSSSERPLTPGLFCRVRIPAGSPHRAILVADARHPARPGQQVRLDCRRRRQDRLPEGGGGGPARRAPRDRGRAGGDRPGGRQRDPGHPRPGAARQRPGGAHARRRTDRGGRPGPRSGGR
jgi:multidrug efflux system membrane fusion protein